VARQLEVAEAGGRHAGFLRNYQGKPPDELRRGIDSLKKQIAEHKDKIANPEKYIPNWKSLEAKKESRISPEDERAFALGRLMAFHEVISLMQQQAQAFGITLEEIGLDDIQPEKDLL
jgi:hypothetical protein